MPARPAKSSMIRSPAPNGARHRQPDDDGHLRPGEPNSSAGNFSTYGTATNSFRRLNQSPSNTLIALSYVDYGQWRRTSTAGATTSVNDTYLVWGSARRRRAFRVPAAQPTARSSTAPSSTRTAPMPSAAPAALLANFAGGTISLQRDREGHAKESRSRLSRSGPWPAPDRLLPRAPASGTGVANGSG